ncbi:hypothetical protein [Marinicella litoralis]|uniref:Uncharacterized protein n=1 Tax=Marinicella litoralis TaxID=644220 RepID=A0A4V3DHU3_9GAMM|nr:hypothetical protein [Marinicella litoralis]TDR19551.1 hypothetical protein C8D91_2108 [Marinicella litoralis]
MSEQTFKVVFKGKIDRTIGLARAKANFAKLFKLPESKVEAMFDGKERTLKKEMPMDKANHFRAVLKKAGIKVSLIKNEVEEVEKTMEDWELNDPGTVILRPIKPPERHIETSHIKVDIDFDHLEDKPQRDPPEVDIDHIVIDESEEPIIVTKEVEVPNFDFSELDLDEVGSIIVRQKKIETPDIPTDDLTLDEAGKQIVEKKEIPEPEIDISNITLDVK